MDTAAPTLAALVALLTVTPGADMALVTRSAVRGGQRAALATSLGIVAGLILWAGLSALGIAALLAATTDAVSVLRLVGAAYLLLLGVWIIWGAGAPAVEENDLGSGADFGQGLLTNLLNPKIAVFYATVVPGFLGEGNPVLVPSLLVAAFHAVLGLAWLNAYAWVLSAVGDRLQRPRVRRALDRTTGSVLVGLGALLALKSR